MLEIHQNTFRFEVQLTEEGGSKQEVHLSHDKIKVHKISGLEVLKTLKADGVTDTEGGLTRSRGH